MTIVSTKLEPARPPVPASTLAYMLTVISGLCIGAFFGLIVGLLTGLIPFAC